MPGDLGQVPQHPSRCCFAKWGVNLTPGLTLAGLLKVEGGKGGNTQQAKTRRQRSQSWRRRETRGGA